MLFFYNLKKLKIILYCFAVNYLNTLLNPIKARNIHLIRGKNKILKKCIIRIKNKLTKPKKIKHSNKNRNHVNNKYKKN